MNEEWITFWVDRKKFTTKLVPNTKPQNKIHYYIMSESESYPIIVESEEDSTSSDSETEMIPDNLKGKFLDEVIALYKNKCCQYIEQKKAEWLASYLKQQAKDIVEKSLGHQVDELLEDEINLALYFTYLKENSMIEWLKYDQYNQKAKLYELIGEEVMEINVKEMLDEILNEYDDVVFKGSHDIGNCKLVKHDIRLTDKKSIKCKQLSRSTKENEWIKGKLTKCSKMK